MIEDLLQRIKRASFYTLHQRSLRANQKWQDSAIQRLVFHVGQTVPFWTTIFKKEGTDMTSINTRSDLTRLPITNKETYRQHYIDHYLDNSRPIFSPWRTTSGSTGEPFTFQLGYSRLDPQYDDFARLRFLLWRNVLLSKLSRVAPARIKITPESRANGLYISMSEFRGNPTGSIKRINAFKPDILESYASILLDISNRVAKNNIRIPYAISYGEMLTSAARSHVEQVFDCEVYDRYGVEEVGVIATECARHNGMHVHCESMFVEIVDHEDGPVSNGGRGRVIVTDLLNYNMPFIRYDTGDYGRLSHETCACGLQTPRLWIEGRHGASISLYGRKIHHLEFAAAMERFSGLIRQYQIAKTNESALQIRIVPATPFNGPILTDIAHEIQLLVGEHALVEATIVSSVHALPSGKSQTLVDESIPR